MEQWEIEVKEKAQKVLRITLERDYAEMLRKGVENLLVTSHGTIKGGFNGNMMESLLEYVESGDKVLSIKRYKELYLNDYGKNDNADI